MQTPYIYVAVILTLFVATWSAAHATSGAVVDLSHFSFTEPDNRDWKKEFVGPRKAVYSLRRGNNYHQMVLLENVVRDPSLRRMSIPLIANHYRNSEKHNMIEMGVNKGLYELLDVTMGEKTVGGKTYYTMKYATKYKKAFNFQRAQLYLLFPEKKEVTDFLFAIYVQSAPSKKKLKESLLSDFLDVLETVRILQNN